MEQHYGIETREFVDTTKQYVPQRRTFIFFPYDLSLQLLGTTKNKKKIAPIVFSLLIYIMGWCCSSKKEPLSETTHLLTNSNEVKYDETATDPPNQSVKEQIPIPLSAPVQVYRAQRLNNTATIPSLERSHIHRKIGASTFIHYLLRTYSSNTVFPEFVIEVISNYTMKQRITSIIYIDSDSNDLHLDLDAFAVDGVYDGDITKMFDSEFKPLCSDFLSGLNSSCMSFGSGGGTVLLRHCMDYILNSDELMNCSLFMKVYGITADEEGREQYVDLLRTAPNVMVSEPEQFENEMLFNMQCFEHLMHRYSYNLREHRPKMVLFEVSLHRILSDQGMPTHFGNVLDAGNNNHILNGMELRVSTLHFGDVGSVNPVHLVENSPNSKLFQLLTLRIRNQHRSLLHLWECIQCIAEKNASRDVMEGMYGRALLTDKLRESLGGNCRTLMLGICSRNQSEKENVSMTLKLAQTAMKVTNRPCINMYYPRL